MEARVVSDVCERCGGLQMADNGQCEGCGFKNWFVVDEKGRPSRPKRLSAAGGTEFVV